MTCGHLRDVSPCIDHFLGKLSPTPRSTATKTETTASSSSRSTSCSSDTDPAVASSCVDQQTAELRLDAVSQRRSSCCSHLRHVHSEVKRRFDRIMATSFGVATAAAAGTSDVYFYLSQAQRTAVLVNTITTTTTTPLTRSSRHTRLNHCSCSNVVQVFALQFSGYYWPRISFYAAVLIVSTR